MRHTISPESAAGDPLITQTFVVTDGILNDEGFDALGMRKDHAEADRAAIVLHVECVALNSERFREGANGASETVKGIVELLRVGPVALPETWEVGRNQMIVVRQPFKKR